MGTYFLGWATRAGGEGVGMVTVAILVCDLQQVYKTFSRFQKGHCSVFCNYQNIKKYIIYILPPEIPWVYLSTLPFLFLFALL